jgi:SAM-dependent methyltransferase
MDKPFNRELRRLRRDRAMRRFAGADYLHRAAGQEILARLDLVTRAFRDALVIGSADPDLILALQEKGMQVTAADPRHRFAHAAGGVQCDEDRLPFGDGRFDLVLSVGVLDSVNDLPGALVLIRRALRPDGLFLAAFAGAGSLPRLRSAMFAADEAEGFAAARIHPQIDVKAAGDLLARVGFALPVADAERVTVRFSGLAALVRDLRAMGATNILTSRAKPIGRLGLGAALADFGAHADPDGKTVENFDIVHLSGWAPAPSQPQPARRGSATTSLAAALRRPEPNSET